ncbi:MAG: hypothetical protein Q8R31_03760 [Candidatus Omnitrophota bacterium]|nr:hypothetical protein [Candidatus Omnitrophota bacterium]
MDMLDLEFDSLEFRSHEKVSGRATWNLEKRYGHMEIRLFWFTRGKGIEDGGIVNTIKIEPITQHGEKRFEFYLPEGPYSFKGQLISLIWAVELVLEPSSKAKRLEITVSPTGKKILLDEKINLSQ